MTFRCYAGTPKKLEDEFNSVRAQLEPCLSNFHKSGMGDCPADERHQQSLEVYYSRKFASYVERRQLSHAPCRMNVCLAYFHVLAFAAGLSFYTFTNSSSASAICSPRLQQRSRWDQTTPRVPSDLWATVRPCQ